MENLFIRRSFIILSFLVFVSISSYAQFNDYNVKFGFQFNGLLTDTDFDKDLRPKNAEFKFSFLGRAFLRFEFFTEALETEVGGGFGRLSGVDLNNLNWWTYIIPFDLRFILSPFEMDVWSPYIFGGAGGMYFKNDKLPSIPSPVDIRDKGWTGIIPVGAGIEIGLSEAVILDISGGYTFTFSDDLNGYNNKDLAGADGKNDGYYSLGLGLSFVSGAGSSDKDKDGLTKREEKEITTDPENPDTDSDGLNDGDEVKKYLTKPLVPDSDADGLKDGEEVSKYQTDPIKSDSDLDDLSDGVEVLKYKTNPLELDTDADGLFDGKEINQYNTNPLKSDSDDDGITDGNEITMYNTNPLKADTDFDGLKDGEEINTYKTDPLLTDTDGGTVDDFTEVNRGTDPLNAEDDVVKVDVPIVLEGITFETGKWDITPESEVVLQGALKTLETYSDIIVEISGHTDNVGSNASNQKLSQKRADAVRFWLINRGVNAERIVAKGYGEDFPRVPNDTSENKRLNRRIEFKRIK